MAAKSGGDFWVVGRGGTSGGGNSAAAKRASSQPSGSGQPTLAAAARFKYSCTGLTESEQLRAICRCSSFSSFLGKHPGGKPNSIPGPAKWCSPSARNRVRVAPEYADDRGTDRFRPRQRCTGMLI